MRNEAKMIRRFFPAVFLFLEFAPPSSSRMRASLRRAKLGAERKIMASYGGELGSSAALGSARV
jgi:hypothetical protein